MTLQSYPSIFNFGHKLLQELFLDPVVVQEKIDGSQFSFGVRDGQVFCRSKGQQINVASPPKMFAAGVAYVQSIADKLCVTHTYRGEYLSKPKHNVLAYDRVPQGFVVLFDIDRGDQDYATPTEVTTTAHMLGFDATPTYFQGKMEGVTGELEVLLRSRTSVLGGPIEGIVIKNYSRYGPDKKVLLGKVVRQEFKETHKKEWNLKDPVASPVVKIIEALRNEARWRKAVQHLGEEGKLVNAPQDIKALLDETIADVFKEESEWIAQKLLESYRKDIARGIVKGLPEWYKAQLAVVPELVEAVTA